MFKLLYRNSLPLLFCYGLCSFYSSQALGDRLQPQEPAGDVEFSEDGTAKSSKLALSDGRKLSKKAKSFDMAQGGAVAPPEPKIKVPKEVSGESVPAPSSPATLKIWMVRYLATVGTPIPKNQKN